MNAHAYTTERTAPTHTHTHTNEQTPPNRNTHTTTNALDGLSPAPLKGPELDRAILEVVRQICVKKNDAPIREIARILTHPEPTVRRRISALVSVKTLEKTDSGGVRTPEKVTHFMKSDAQLKESRSFNKDPGDLDLDLLIDSASKTEKVRQILAEISGILGGPVPYLKLVGEQISEALDHFSPAAIVDAFHLEINANGGRWVHSKKVLGELAPARPAPIPAPEGESWIAWEAAGFAGDPPPTSGPVMFSAWKVGRARALRVPVSYIDRNGEIKPEGPSAEALSAAAWAASGRGHRKYSAGWFVGPATP